MAFFQLNIDTDNAAFEDERLTTELSIILKDIAEYVKNGAIRGPIYDSNGNKVGAYGHPEGAEHTF